MLFISRAILIASAILAVEMTAHAQLLLPDINLSRHQIRFSFAGLAYNPLAIQNTGPQLLTSPRSLSMEFSLQYSMPVFKTFRVNMGLGYTRIPIRYDYAITDLAGSPFEGLDNGPFTSRGMHPSVTQGVWTIPISVERSFAVFPNKSWRLNFEAGMKFNIKTKYPFAVSGKSISILENGGDYEYFSYELESAPIQTYASYSLKAGVIKFNKYGDTFHINAVYQHAPAPLMEGTYQFENLGYQSFGTLSQRPGLYGLEFAYGITVKKRKR